MSVQEISRSPSLSELSLFRTAIEACNSLTFIVDRETLQFVDCTPIAAASAGLTREQMLKLGPLDLVEITREDLERGYDEVIAAGAQGLRGEAITRLKNGGEIVMESDACAMFMDGRWLIASTMHDITERKKAEQAVVRLSQMFAALSESNEAILRGGAPAELYQRVCDAAVNGGKFMAASICIPDEAGVEALTAGMSGYGPDARRDIRVPLHEATAEGRSFIGSAYRTQTPCISNDFQHDERTRPWHERARRFGVASAAAFPLLRAGKTVAIMLFYSRHLDAFDEQVVDLLARMSRNLVFALENYDREQERRRSEQLLRDTQARLDRATRGANDGLWEYNLQTQAVWVSPRHAEMIGYTYGDCMRDGPAAFSAPFHGEDAELSAAMTLCATDGTPVDVEVRGKTGTGEHRWYRIRAALQRDEQGRALTLSGSLQDVTERIKHQQALIEATETAASANRAKSEFLANMSHEIRTPMNGVIGMSELLLETALNPIQLDYAETVRDSAKALLTVINDILDFSKVEAGKLELEYLDMDLRDTVEDVARLLAIQAHAKSLEVIALLDPRLPDIVRGDAGRLRQILLNLGGNAVKFTQTGEVSIDCRLAGQDNSALTLRFEVGDTGMGIPASRLGSLFEAFSQVDASTTRKFGGTGLGLSIVKRLVELMEGEVGVTSEEGAGSTFWFTVRLRCASDETQTHGIVPTELNGQRVLVVDDNSTNRKVLMGQLSLCRMDPVCAGSADEAVSIMRQAAMEGRPFGAALLDHQMPGCDGAKLGKMIMSDAAIADVRLILLTSSGQRGDGHLFSELGFAGYLLKPVTQRDLTDCLAMVFGARAEVWQRRTQPILTRHALRSLRASEEHRVLLAEDNEVNQKVACRVLEKLGYRVDVASDGKAAVNAWATGRYDLILMDCQMPVMDGYEASRQIRRHELSDQHIPIIALTAHAMKGSDAECSAAGMDDYLSKPIDREKLRACLQRWLVKSGDSSAAQDFSGAASA